MKPLVRHERADRDIQEAIGYYLLNAPEVALSWVDALEHTFHIIEQRPATGSPRYAHELGIPGLRFRRCKRFPHLVFHVETEDQIHIWRVLHGSRDIPAWLHEETAAP